MSKALQQALEDWQRAGVSDLPPAGEPLAFAVGESPAETGESTRDEPTRDETTRGETTRGEAATEEEPTSATPMASDMAAEAKLDLLSQRVAQCTRCQELAETRTQTVFGVGDPQASIMFVGEAPGADEDRAGKPFVGKAGKLLDDIITAGCGWRREELYICNILRCRPPGNRNPSDAEAANCREYLDGQIEAVQPDWIVCWGAVAAKNLLGVDEPIGKLRKQLFDHADAKVLCTYHPSYLLRNPSAKKDVWSDLQFLFEAMGYTPPSMRKQPPQ